MQCICAFGATNSYISECSAFFFLTFPFFNLSLALIILNDVHGEVFHSCQKHVMKTSCSNCNCSHKLAGEGKVLEKFQVDLTHLEETVWKGLTQQHISIVCVVITYINDPLEMGLFLA